MSQQELISAIVREVMAELGNGQKVAPVAPPPATNGHKLNYRNDYPLAEKHPDLVKTATGKGLAQITLDAVLNGEVTAEEIRITPQTLEYPAQIAESIDRPQLAASFRRAAEMIAIPDARILEMYNALRPNRSSKQELLAIADELADKYGAKKTAAFVREAVEVYEARNVLREE